MNDVYARYNSTVEASNRAEQDVQRIQEQLDDLSEFYFFLRFFSLVFFFLHPLYFRDGVGYRQPPQSRIFFGDVHFPFPFVLALELI